MVSFLPSIFPYLGLIIVYHGNFLKESKARASDQRLLPISGAKMYKVSKFSRSNVHESGHQLIEVLYCPDTQTITDSRRLICGFSTAN